MAGRIRTIKPEVLDDETALDLSDTAWRLWVSIWLLADDHGRFRATPRYLAAEVWKDTRRAKDAADGLDELARAGMLRRYDVQGERYAELKPAGWKRHQRIDHPGKPRVPVPAEGRYLDAEHRRSPAGRPIEEDEHNDSEDLPADSRRVSEDRPTPNESLGGQTDTERESRKPSALARARGTMVGGRGPDPLPIPEPSSPEHTHNARAQDPGRGEPRGGARRKGLPIPGDPATAEILDELRRYDFFRKSAALASVGPDEALLKLASTIAGKAMSTGNPVAWYVAAVSEAATKLEAESSGESTPPAWTYLAGKIAAYAHHARGPSTPNARASPAKPLPLPDPKAPSIVEQMNRLASREAS